VSRSLAVILEGRLVGHVERTRAGALRLTYTEDAREYGLTPLSLSLPTDRLSITGDAVETYLRALLPDNERTLRSIARQAGADPRDLVELLAAVGKDCAGAVQLCPPDEVEQTIARTGALVPVSDADLEQRLAELRMNEDASWTMRGEHWSLGGTQNKFALRREGDAWFEAQGAEATSHILKPGIHRLTAQALVEHVTMRSAHACGVSVAATQYAEFKTEPAIVVTRFDRRRDGADLVRLHQEDMCQALGRSEKYEEHGGPTAAEILRLLRESAPTPRDATENVRRFVDGLLFNTLVAAPDAHARNYAVLLTGDRVQLAPLYDVATGLAYEAQGNRVQSMSIGGEFAVDRIGRTQWERFAEQNHLDGQAVIRRAREMADTIPGAMRQALDEVDDWDGTVGELRRRLTPAVEAHMSHLSKALA
jgi:serine/threonine-protein kinase HipA